MIPEWMHGAPMLAEEFQEKRVTYPIIAEDKLDGLRCLFVNGQGYTRQRFITYDSFAPFARALYEVTGPEVFVDTELAASNFNETVKLLKRKKDLNFEAIKTNVVCHVFDVVTPHTINKITYAARRREVKRLITELHQRELDVRFEMTKAVTLKSAEDVPGAFQSALDRGVEGLILKPLDAVYKTVATRHPKGTRCYNFMKLKPWVDIIVTVTGVLPGEGLCPVCSTKKATGSKLGCSRCKGTGEIVKEGVLGALVCKTEDGSTLKVGSGFTAEQRLAMWKDRARLVGRKLDLVVQDDANDIVGRHPVFKRWRDDR